jgi:hypothetical protein
MSQKRLTQTFGPNVTPEQSTGTESTGGEEHDIPFRVDCSHPLIYSTLQVQHKSCVSPMLSSEISPVFAGDTGLLGRREANYLSISPSYARAKCTGNGGNGSQLFFQNNTIKAFTSGI